MKINEGLVDRAIRVLLGCGLLVLVFVGPKTLWGLFGLIPLTTGLVGFCPLYAVLGFSTCSTQRQQN
jgi:cadmium resistance protein CadD (predicted permease)